MYYWNHFAYPVTVAGTDYAFLTDRKVFLRITASIRKLLDNRQMERGEFDTSKLPESTVQSLVATGILSELPPREQFDRTMKVAEASSELNLLHIITSYTCNLSCSYCFMLSDLSPSAAAQKFLPFTEAKDGIDHFFSQPHDPESVVHFYGGEPLLHPQLIMDCLDYITSNYSQRIRPKMVTNGMIVNPAVHKLLSKYRFDVAVSLDGDLEANDAFRVDHAGRSSYQRVVDGIRFFQEELGYGVKILITVGEHNIDRLPEIANTVLDLSPVAIALNFPRELGGVESGLGGSDGEKREYWVRQYERALEVCFDRGIPELYFGDMLTAFLRNRPVLKPCAACGNQLSVGPGGRVGPCQAFVAAGKFEVPLTLLQIGKRPPEFSDWDSVSKASSSKCSQCPIAAICGADCSFDRYNRSGNLHEPLAFHCDLRLRMAAILAERVVTGRSIGFATDYRLTDVN